MRRLGPGRVFDLVLATALLAVTSPLWPFIAIAIKWTSSGPVFHVAQRCGVDGRTFPLYKFRTMRVASAPPGSGITAGADPRVTRVGAFLRHWKLDELPQLLNVIKGDMSFVGPRPEDPRYVDGYSEEERGLLRLRPGITSPASILFRQEQELLGQSDDPEVTYRQVILPRKLAVDLQYFSSNSLYSDIRILFETARVILLPRNHALPKTAANEINSTAAPG